MFSPRKFMYSAITLCCLASTIPANAADQRKVILDDDIAGPRAAQLMALMSPNVDVLGITVVSGDAWRDENVAHALRMLEIAGRTDIPVVPGAIFPLLNTKAFTNKWEALHGRLVWKGAWMDDKFPEGTIQTQPKFHGPYEVPHLPEGDPQIKPSNEIAANFLIRKVHEFPGQVSIIATGPLTNLALAARLDPTFAATAKELIYMGGSVNPHQQLTSKSAEQFGREYRNTPRLEFNFRWDPEAARIVLREPWKHIVMIPVDPSTATELTPKLLNDMTASQTPIAKALRQYNEAGFPLWDDIATAVWLDPSIITQSDDLLVDVDTDSGAGYGNTLSWAQGWGPDLGERVNTVVRNVNVKALEKMMITILNRPQPQASPTSIK
ncbi:nucleoside hydrolase [Aquirhabdus sp.]|uniref:nucleoside hydrolase n=1 Tax=Aquirhabdus sp. TaxID=2824160 RepID=UPI00396C6E71